MKKFKLLTTCLSTLTVASLLPLTSCSNKQITENDWKKTFGVIANCRDESRNFTVDGKITVDEDDLTFNAKAVGTLNDGRLDDDTNESDHRYLSCLHNDIFWIKHNDTLAPYYSSKIVPDDMIGYFSYIGGILRDSFKCAKFTDTTHCDFNWSGTIEGETLEASGKFEFDSNKRITKIDLFGKAFELEGNVLVTFSNYGSTSLDWTIDQKFDFSDYEVTANKSGNNFVAQKTTPIPAGRYHGIAYLFNLPDDLELTDLKYLKITNGAKSDGDVEVILNGKELVKGTDYSLNSTFDKITLTNPVKKGDKLRFMFEPFHAPCDPIVILTATEE